MRDGKPAAKLNGKDISFTDVTVKGKGPLTTRVTTGDDGVVTTILITGGGGGGIGKGKGKAKPTSGLKKRGVIEDDDAFLAPAARRRFRSSSATGADAGRAPPAADAAAAPLPLPPARRPSPCRSRHGARCQHMGLTFPALFAMLRPLARHRGLSILAVRSGWLGDSVRGN